MPSRVAFLLALATAACASGGTPAPESVERVAITGAPGGISQMELHRDAAHAARTVPASVDSVWRALPEVYEQLGVPNPGADAERHVFGAQNFKARRIERKRLSTYIDCGTGPTAVPKADEYEVTMTLLTRLTPAEDGGTVVTTQLEASARPRGVTGNTVFCQSNGVLESRVGELVLWVLVSGR